MQYIAVLGYKDIFREDIPENPLEFIKDYPTEFLLLRLSKINAMLFQDPDTRKVDSEIIEHAIFTDIEGFQIPAEFQNNFKSEKRWFSPAPIAMLITEMLKDLLTIVLLIHLLSPEIFSKQYSSITSYIIPVMVMKT